MSSVALANHAGQSVNPGCWWLAGEVEAGHGQNLLSQHSLKLVRNVDSLSPKIKSAIAAHSFLPYVEIATRVGKVKLWNAQVVNILHAFEREEVHFTFQEIEMAWAAGA
jgi:hypothetical protein